MEKTLMMFVVEGHTQRFSTWDGNKSLDVVSVIFRAWVFTSTVNCSLPLCTLNLTWISQTVRHSVQDKTFIFVNLQHGSIFFDEELLCNILNPLMKTQEMFVTNRNSEQLVIFLLCTQLAYSFSSSIMLKLICVPTVFNWSNVFKVQLSPKKAILIKGWGLLSFFSHCLCLSDKDLSLTGTEGWARTCQESETRRVRNWKCECVGGDGGQQWWASHRGGGKGTSLLSSSRGLEFLPSCLPPPHLAGTCENNSPAFSHPADPIAISTLEGMRLWANPDRHNTEGGKGEGF